MNAAVAIEPQVDPRNPWLGLASFTEETRAYFFGREEEVAELARRVQRKLLTVLFGQSGLGKTSILRAGLVPKLRSQGYCPVYVRIDYGAEAPEPAEQIKHAIALTATGSGQWTQAGVAATGESLWEFLHHRDDVLRDASGQTLTPLLIFDQFEEIFTLAQSDDTGRARAARFIQDLADLVENRPPRAFEERLETDDTAAERFDFARSDYRVLISLREDYLAPLESLKRDMPSIAQNRLRLAPMTGQQALAAVMKPGKGLVNDEVAAAIVRFVAGGSELPNAEVEPALLSLVCRELNDARIAAGRSEISPDLLEGSQDMILSNFYERSLADQPPAVRRIIEDELLTASGFRENIAEERLISSFMAAGAVPQTLRVLVNRRLLRVEERLDLRRVELTHDVLCSVVRKSRDLRKEREAREDSDRLLQEQRDKEAAARAALVRARKIASVCAVLALVAVAAAVFAVISTQRARRAEQATQQARIQAEGLISYLSDDFATQLETFGQLAMISQMARHQIDYFHGLPDGLKNTESIRNAAKAMTAYANAERAQTHQKSALESINEAIGLLEGIRAKGDASEATTIALGNAYGVLSGIQGGTASTQTIATASKATALLQPIAEAPRASEAAKIAYARNLGHLAYEQQFLDTSQYKNANDNLQHARDILASLGAAQMRTIEIAALYADGGCWQAEVLMKLARDDEAHAIDVEALELAKKVLAKRPDYHLAMHAAQVISIDLGIMASNRLDPAEGMVYAKSGIAYSEQLLARDPASSSAHNNAGVSYGIASDLAWALGMVDESFDFVKRAHDVYGGDQRQAAWFILNSVAGVAGTFAHMAEAGQEAKARNGTAEMYSSIESYRKTPTASLSALKFMDCARDWIDANISLAADDYATASGLAARARERIQNVAADSALEPAIKAECEYYAPMVRSYAQFLLQDYAGMEKSAQQALAARDQYTDNSLSDIRAINLVYALQAIGAAKRGDIQEATRIITPVVEFERGLAARNKGDLTQRLELATALYAQSVIDKSRQAALRREGLAIIKQFPEAFRKLNGTERVRRLLEAGP